MGSITRFVSMYKAGVRYFLVILAILTLLAAGPAAAQRSRSKKSLPVSKARQVSTSKKGSVSAGKRSPRTTRARPSRGRRRAVARGPVAPSPERIRQIQQALLRSGHYRREPTGKMDASTVAALGSFQEANGLQPTGKLNAWTLRKLEEYGLPANSRASAAPPAAPNP